MAKRAWGTGCIEEYQPGSWRVRTRNANKQLITIASGLTEAEANEYADALTVIKSRRGRFTMGQLVELTRAERYAREDLKTSTLRNEQSVWADIKRNLGRLELQNLVRRDIVDYIDRAKAASTKRNRKNLISYALDMAVERGLIERNISLDVKVRGKTKKLGKRDLLERIIWPGEQLKIIEELLSPKRFDATDRQRLMLLSCFLFSLGTGTRLSEMWGVKREDVSQKGVLVCRSVANEAPKSGEWREIPWVPASRAAMVVWSSIPWSYKASKSEWLYSGRSGDQFTYSKQPEGWAEILKACRLKHRRYHDIRHTTATALLAGWWGPAWSLEEVKALMGHASVTTTEIYAQLLDDRAFAAAAKSSWAKQMKAQTVDLLAVTRRLLGETCSNAVPNGLFSDWEKDE